MSRYKTFIIVFLIFWGCSFAKPISNEKTDLFSLSALMLIEDGNYYEAIKFLEENYKNTKDIQYLNYALNVALIINDEKIIQNLISISPKNATQNKTYLDLYIRYLVNKNELQKAESLLKSKSKQCNNDRYFALLASIQAELNKHDEAIKNYKKAISIEDKSIYILSLAELYININEFSNSLDLLQGYLHNNKCDKMAFMMYLKSYNYNSINNSNKQTIDEFIKIFKNYYRCEKDISIANGILIFLTSMKRFDEAQSFIKEAKVDDKALISYYYAKEDLKKVYELSYKVYEKTKDVNFLAQSAISQYEYNKLKITDDVLNSVLKKCEIAVSKSDNANLFNYCGYLLIDHDKNITKGMKQVQKALKLEPKNIYFLDSLAWGYYKLGNCDKAYEIMKPLVNKTNEQEILSHYESIKKCLKK